MAEIVGLLVIATATEENLNCLVDPYLDSLTVCVYFCHLDEKRTLHICFPERMDRNCLAEPYREGNIFCI